MSLSIRFAVGMVRTWTRVYTWRMPSECRDNRRAEIESDLWELQQDADDAEGPGAVRIFLRLVLGMPDDVGWRIEQEVAARSFTQESVAYTARLVGAAFFVGTFWVIDVDANRPRAFTTFIDPSIVGDQQVEEVMPAATNGALRPSAIGCITCHARLLAAGIAAAVGLSMPSPLPAQSPVPGGPAFKTTAITLNTSGDGRMRFDPQPGRFMGTNVTAAMLVRFAYDLPHFQETGGPAWLNLDRFDVVATADRNVTPEQTRIMLRTMLADRFRLTAHTETRELPTYTLTTARADRRLGAQLRRTQADCALANPPEIGAFGPSPPEGLPDCGFFGFTPRTDFASGSVGLAFRGLTMGELAKWLIPVLRRNVNDQTGLVGYFDADLDFIAELPPPPPPPGMPNPFEKPFGSIFTIFPEQLGLKLESTTAPVEVLVVDRAERPTPD